VATAERAAEAAKSAKQAAEAANAATETAYNVVVEQCRKKVESIEALDQAVADIGTADGSVTNAKDLGTQLNTMMSSAKEASNKAQALMNDAKTEHSFRHKDLKEKTENRERMDKLIADSLIEEQRKVRYLERAKAAEEDWGERSAQVTEYVNEVRKSHTDATNEEANAELAASDNEAAATGIQTQLDTAQKELEDGADSVKALAGGAGQDMLAKLLSARAKWAKKASSNMESRLSEWTTAVDAALPNLITATKNAAAATRTYERIVATQDNLEADATGPRNKMKIVLVAKQEEEIKLQKELAVLSTQQESAEREQKHWQGELERLEKLRRETSLDALALRVESIWKKRAKLHDPDNKRRLEKSVYLKITAAWDRDGTPLGPGGLDTWYLDASKITYAHENVPGYLHEGVTSRCSSACSEYADLQCNEGHVSRSCTRGRVYRARFQRTGTIEAQNDWFVCRCNTGVMQFVGTENLEVLRQKNRLMQASVTPEGITFDTRLHAEEMIPDSHVHCFRDFEEWLTKKTDFAQPDKIDELDALALSKPEEAVAAYNTVKQLWYEQCLKQDLPGPASTTTHPGSTDSSLDILELTTMPENTLDVTQQATTDASSA